MSDTKEWRALEGLDECWAVTIDGIVIVAGLDRDTAHRIAAVNEMERAAQVAAEVLEYLAGQKIGLPPTEFAAINLRAALSKARGET